MEKSLLKMSVSASGTGTQFAVALNDQVLWSGDPGADACEISHEFDDSDGIDYALTLTMSGKTAGHTVLDHAGAIAQDLLVKVHSLSIDSDNVMPVFQKLAQYQHNFNGTGADGTDKFYGTMGCNGQVVLHFKSPSYIWLLENI
jgi:hypothetical protein